MSKSILSKAIPGVLLGVISVSSGHGMENAGGASIFSADDLKELMANSHSLKQRKIAHLDQKTDVITFYASTDSDEEIQEDPHKAGFSGTEKPEPFTWFGKELEPSADLKVEFSVPQFQKIISDMKVTSLGDSGSTPSSNEPTGFDGDPYQ